MSSKTHIDLATGYPAPSLLPAEQLKDAAAIALSNQTVWEDGMVYGADPGYLPLRENIAKWLTGFYASPKNIPVERICITGGASQNLACILQVYTDPIKTRKVWIVEPSYYLGFRIFEDAGFGGRLHGVPEGMDGVDIAFLENALEEDNRPFNVSDKPGLSPVKPSYPYRKFYSHVIYCVPTFSNPSGVIMSRPRREALLRLARKYDALIIADDVYDFVHWDVDSQSGRANDYDNMKALQPRFVDLDDMLDGGPQDEFGNCVSNGSFSKILGPGCRVGWAEGTAKFTYGLSQAGSTRSGGAPSHLMSTFVNELFINNFISTNIASTLLPTYRRRYFILDSAIRAHLLPLGVTFNPATSSRSSAGGFFFWLKLPSPLTAHEVLEVALREQNLRFGIGPLSALPEGNERYSGYEEMIRLCFTRIDEGELTRGVVRLATVLRGFLDCI
ncbi:pyridoxal phosphate-dependent transferase [Aspergillus ambiguus]|uniref:aminotransferase-like domain-containing protein n=1 Tax=Aspergillus ambiguus TaxID=176160 RepID=UPI003CCDFEFC